MTKKKYVLISAFLFLCVLLVGWYAFFSTPSSKTYTLPVATSRPSVVPVFFPPSLTIPGIFSQDHSWTSTLSAEHIRIITATGDIIPARSVNNSVVVHHDPLWPYEKIADKFKQKKSDALFINLESPLLPDCKPTIEGMVFCGESQNIDGLKYIGVTVANLANNHQGNYGLPGIQSTLNILTSNGILPTGTNGAVFKDIRGKKFAFLGYNDIGAPENGISWADETRIKTEVSAAKSQSDIVLVQFHWGIEYQNQPSLKQRALGHLAIDSGADLVIGNHPHWIEPVEIYKGKIITYAHGNFIFDQMWSQKTREGVIGWYVFYDNQLIDIEYLPLQIDDYGQPHFVDGVQKQSILSDMFNQSLILSKTTPTSQ